jgi:hypothetical protein
MTPGRQQNRGFSIGRFSRLTIVALLALLVCSAQTNRGALTGVVTDPSGAIVPGVTVKVTHMDTGVVSSTVATDTGAYTLPTLPIGAYRVEFEAAGFKHAIRDKVELAAGATLRIDLVLEVGSVGESVEVAAQASPLETETTRVATTINTKLVADLPLFGMAPSEACLRWRLSPRRRKRRVASESAAGKAPAGK